MRLQGRPAYYYPLSLVALGVAAIIFLFIALPDLFSLFISGLIDFFGQNPYALTVQEARSWTLGEAWTTFWFRLPAHVRLGLPFSIYRIWKEGRPVHLYTVRMVGDHSLRRLAAYQVRVLSRCQYRPSLCVLYRIAHFMGRKRCCRPIEVGKDAGQEGEKGEAERPSRQQVKQPQENRFQERKSRSKKRRKKPGREGEQWTKTGILAIACIFGALFVISSVGFDYAIASGATIRMNPDWRESLEWMGNNTPDTGVDYYKVYEEATFTYPNQSYGVMSWWDYGHMITFIAKRIPNANPFQAGVTGPNGSAAFFVSTSEDTADTILDNQGTKYVITDIEMDTGKFWAMATWFNSTLGATPYHPAFFVQDPANPNQYQQAILLVDNYYLTTVSRLHNFDGSYTEPTTAYYIEYTDANVSGQSLPVITRAELMNATDAHAAADEFNARAPVGKHAIVGNPAWSSIFQPTTTIPALSHYRIVHESPH